MFLKTNLDGFLGCCAAIRDMDHRDLLPKIKAPTLVIAGSRDGATPPALNEFIRDHIPGAKYALLDAAHIANVEQPQAYTDTVLNFLLGR
jgi:3-oxoadipate enol-lactonase